MASLPVEGAPDTLCFNGDHDTVSLTYFATDHGGTARTPGEFPVTFGRHRMPHVSGELQMPVRLKDIARDLGVSAITVSKALRGASDISEKTRQRVLKRIAELNYRPNMLARGLASGKTWIVGLVVPDLLHPFFAEFAKSLSGVLRQHNYGLILASSEEDPEIEKQEIRAVLARGVDALLIASCQTSLQGYSIDDQRTPFILVDRDFPHLPASFVGTDDYRAGLLATRHLLAIGRRRIAHIAGPELSPGIDRLRGFQAALAERQRKVLKGYVIANARVEEAGESAGYAGMRELLRRKPCPDAVFCYNDLTAIGAMQAATEAGLRIPEDVAFVGCGNLRYSSHLRIPLSSIDQSTGKLGDAAGRLALELMQDRNRTPQHIVLEPQLIVRASSVPEAKRRPEKSAKEPAGVGRL
jgi:LacI family transcriptional regulator